MGKENLKTKNDSDGMYEIIGRQDSGFAIAGMMFSLKMADDLINVGNYAGAQAFAEMILKDYQILINQLAFLQLIKEKYYEE